MPDDERYRVGSEGAGDAGGDEGGRLTPRDELASDKLGSPSFRGGEAEPGTGERLPPPEGAPRFRTSAALPSGMTVARWLYSRRRTAARR